MARVLVTGASTGLGLATGIDLADAGHEVVLHARHASRFDDPSVLDRMHGTVLGDLSHHEETLEVARRAAELGPFDAVIHNAGVMRGADVFSVNVVAPFVLTARMPLPGRAVFLGSSMHRSGSPDLASLDLADASSRGGAYQDSKLYVAALAMGLARRLGAVLVHTVDPGWVPTRMGGPAASDDFAAGHRTQEWLATADPSEISPRTGGYWYHRAPARPHPAVLDEDFQDELIHRLEHHAGLPVPT